jgi:hypothetical protein
MIKLTKGEGVKFLSPESSLIPMLVHEGWEAEGSGNKKPAEAIPVVADDKLAELRAEAEALGLSVHHKTGVAKLTELIEEAKSK